jgi:hypothetical protein
MFPPHEAAELAEIAEVWGAPVATALWAIVVDPLARYRRRAPELGEHGLGSAAGLALTRSATDAAVRRAKGGGSSPAR